MPETVQTESSWPSWKIALAVGVPVIVGGVGYYYYKKTQPTKDDSQVSSNANEPRKNKVNVEEPVAGTPQVAEDARVEEDPFKVATNFKNEGNTFFKQGQFDKAIQHYTKAINVCPSNKKLELSTFHQNKAAAFEKLENWQGVVDECSKAIDLNPRYVKALFRRSRALETLGKKSECLEDVTAVCIMEQFQNPSSMMFADKVLKEMGKEMSSERYKTREPVMPSILFVRQYFASFTEDVISEPLTEDQKKDIESGYIRARLALDNEDIASVIPECTAEIEGQATDASQEAGEQTQMEPSAKEPKYLGPALLLRGTMHLLQGKTKQASLDLDTVIGMETADVKLRANALVKRGSLFMQGQNAEQAQEDFDNAVKLDPQNTDVLHHRGQLHILVDKTEAALKDFESCIKLKPDFALAHAQHCYSVYRQAFGRRDVVETQKAIAKFDELIEKFPNCSESYGLYAQALTDQGDYQKADDMFCRAIKVEPDNATQYVHRGLLHLQWKQDIAESLTLIEKALEIDDKCDFAHETMGTIEVQRGNLDKACKHFDIALNLAKSEMEMAHLYSLRAAAVAQANLAKKYGIKSKIPQP